jgi:hypothetical protein
MRPKVETNQTSTLRGGPTTYAAGPGYVAQSTQAGQRGDLAELGGRLVHCRAADPEPPQSCTAYSSNRSLQPGQRISAGPTSTPQLGQ